MREPVDRPPGQIRRLLRRLFSGPRGMDVLEDLDREYSAVRQRYPRAVAWGWYLLQLIRPGTWRLAWVLRRIQKEEGPAHTTIERRDRRLTWLSGLSLDLKLAWRMLLKSPLLTLVSVLGIGLATAVSIGFFILLSNFFFPRLPLDEGDRIIALENWDVEANNEATRSLHDFLTWREEMRSVEQIAAVSMGYRDLVTGDALRQPVRAAEMTAAGFQIARVPPLLGRYLAPEDEREDAPRVAVIGYDLWHARFGGDPQVIGRSVLLGGAEHMIVGVMPPGFAFPENQEIWTTLRPNPTRYERGEGPELFVFGRLAPSATRQQAQAELTFLGRRAAAAFPETNAGLRPQVLPYTYPLNNTRALQLREVAQIQLTVNLLLIAIVGNIAVLLFARTAMRQREIAVRSALGAGRRRIVGQLFIEALLLSILGAGVGLGLAHAALRRLETIFDPEGVAFWVHNGLQPRSVVFALVLAIFCAVIVGVVPALKSTRRRLNADLRRLGDGASVHLGRAWTALIVVQVTVAIAALPTALYLGLDTVGRVAERATFPAHEFMTGRLGLAVPIQPGMDGENYRREATARFAVRLPELERRLEAEPAVAGVTFEGRLPGRGGLVEVEQTPQSPQRSGSVQSIGVATDYFELLGARVLAGREFRTSDVVEPGGGLIVNEAFVRVALNGGPALGTRVRFLQESTPGQDTEERIRGPWLNIVGVVEDLYASAFDRERAPLEVYYAVAPAQLQQANLLVRVRAGDAGRRTPQLLQIAETVDPDFRFGAIENLATVGNARLIAAIVDALLFALCTVLLLSAAGIHALMSITVTRRRKEIGIHIALGSRPGRLLARIFSGAARQLGIGVLVGSLFGGALLIANEASGWTVALLLGGVVLLMLTVGLIAVVEPARRGLRIQPMEALREE